MEIVDGVVIKCLRCKCEPVIKNGKINMKRIRVAGTNEVLIICKPCYAEYQAQKIKH